MSIEPASKVYDELMNTIGQKAKKSLENVKGACDLIISSRGVLNYSSVARVATEQYGGPKKQSVQNNENLKRYITARNGEYTNTRQHHRMPDTKNKGKEALKSNKTYPVENLDPRTKVFIDNLLSRLNLAENRYKDLRKWQEEFTKVNPLDLAELIGKGPTTTGALQLEYQQLENRNNDTLITSIKSLLDLMNHIDSIKVEERGDVKRLTLYRPSGNHVILTPSQFAALEELVGGTKNK